MYVLMPWCSSLVMSLRWRSKVNMLIRILKTGALPRRTWHWCKSNMLKFWQFSGLGHGIKSESGIQQDCSLAAGWLKPPTTLFVEKVGIVRILHVSVHMRTNAAHHQSSDIMFFMSCMFPTWATFAAFKFGASRTKTIGFITCGKLLVQTLVLPYLHQVQKRRFAPNMIHFANSND